MARHAYYFERNKGTVAKSQKTYGIVVDYFKKKIIAGDLKPGEKLPPEREIAEELGVSRNSVREAIRFMDMTGVISSQQGSGNYITCDFQSSLEETMGMMFAMDQIDYIQISQIRYSLERLAFTLALDHASEEEIRLMEEYVNKLDKSTDASVNNELDKKIHYTLARASGNVLILDILEACSSVIDEFVKDLRREIIRKESGKEALNACHHRIVKALREHNREDGILALKEHFAIIDEILLEWKNQ